MTIESIGNICSQSSVKRAYLDMFDTGRSFFVKTGHTAIALCCLFFLSGTLASASPKVADYVLDATFYPDKSFMEGKAVVTMDWGNNTENVSNLTFYLHSELRVDSVIINGHEMTIAEERIMYGNSYSLLANRVSMKISGPAPAHLTVYYQGYFHRSNNRSPSDYMRIDDDGVLLRSYGYSLWFPIFLESGEDTYATSFSKVNLRVPGELTPVFAGERIEERTEGDWRISRWRAKSLDLRAAQVTARRYVVTSEDDFYLYHADDSISRASAATILSLARRLTDSYAAYYRNHAATGQNHIMQMPKFGDISSGNVNGISSDIWRQFNDVDWSVRTLAHEIVHPYVNTGLSVRDSIYALGIEGFPSYFHLPVLAETKGEDWLDSHMKRIETAYLKRRKTGLGWRDRPVPPEKPLTKITPGEVGRYKDMFLLNDRAPLFLHWIRRQLGNEKFFGFTKELFNTGPISYATFKEIFLRHLPDSGNDFDIWMTSTEFPSRFSMTGQ